MGIQGCHALSDLIETEVKTPAASMTFDVANGSSRAKSMRVIAIYAAAQALVATYTHGNEADLSDAKTSDVELGGSTATVKTQILDFHGSADGRYFGVTFPVAPAAVIVEYYNHQKLNGFMGHNASEEMFTSLQTPYAPAATAAAVTATATDHDYGNVSNALPHAGNVSTGNTACSAGATTYAVVAGSETNGVVSTFNATTGAYTFGIPSLGAWEFSYELLCDGVVVGTGREFGVAV